MILAHENYLRKVAETDFSCIFAGYEEHSQLLYYCPH